MIVIVAGSHPWADGERRDVGDFRQTPWVMREPGSGTRHAFESLVEAAGFDLSAIDVSMELPANETVIGAVEAGLGATLMSRSIAAPLLKGGAIVEANIAPLPRPFFLLRHEERYRSKAADAFDRMISTVDGDPRL